MTCTWPLPLRHSLCRQGLPSLNRLIHHRESIKMCWQQQKKKNKKAKQFHLLFWPHCQQRRRLIIQLSLCVRVCVCVRVYLRWGQALCVVTHAKLSCFCFVYMLFDKKVNSSSDRSVDLILVTQKLPAGKKIASPLFSISRRLSFPLLCNIFASLPSFVSSAAALSLLFTKVDNIVCAVLR